MCGKPNDRGASAMPIFQPQKTVSTSRECLPVAEDELKGHTHSRVIGPHARMESLRIYVVFFRSSSACL